MNNRPLKELLEKYNSDNCTEEEKVWVENWYHQQDNSSPLSISGGEFEEDINEVFSKLPTKGGLFIKRQWFNIAAMLIEALLIIGLSVYFNNNISINKHVLSLSLLHPDLEPGGNKAQLRLADNSIILLDNMKVGEIYEHNNFRIRKSENGVIEYFSSIDEKDLTDDYLFNEISTPNGGQYQILLPDGSKVWLNASTTLKYPMRFSSLERLVELSGEAYFEVSKQKTPFYVKTEGQKIEVLGTHFNVNAYHDERETKTTLIEGSVKVITGLEENVKERPDGLVLKPGEQSILHNKEMKVRRVDVSQEIAWKSGFFSFQGAGIDEVMREFSRWYDVEVQFEGSMPDTKLWGEIYRNAKASQALKILEYFDMKFKIINDKEVSRIEISNK